MTDRLISILACAAIAIPSFGSVHPSARGISLDYPRKYSDWQNSLLAGNGKTGIMVFGNPRSETIIFNARNFNFPGTKPRTFAEVPTDTVLKISNLCAESRFEEANALAVASSQWTDGGEGGRHPGFVMEINMSGQGEITGYRRECDYSTGEITVSWNDAGGEWLRKCFVSRDEDISAFLIENTDGRRFDCSVSLRMPAEANYPAGMSASGYSSDSGSIGIDVKYPAPSDSQGYSGLIVPTCEGGRLEVRNDTLFAHDVIKLTLLARLGKTGSRHPSCRQLDQAMSTSTADYSTLFSRHTAIHSAIFDRVSLDLGAAPKDRMLSNEELLSRQKDSDAPIPALWERLFYSGRYHFLSASSELTPPDLLGIWTGDCNAGWAGYYHLDANLNLQVAAGNIGNMPEAMEGYFNLNEAWIPDFETNARRLLGCRGLLACGNTPGLSSGLMAAINDYYPYHYATGEESWLLYPFWEHYLTTGDTTFLRNRLFPLLTKMCEFYQDFLRHRDSNGKFIIAGSVSPENRPSNRPVSLLNNSAFDLAGARWALSTLIKSCDILGIGNDPGGWRDIAAKLYSSLPDYRINDDGAIAEWGWEGLDDNYAHRHSSHLMMVWPYRETSPSNRHALYRHAVKALELRDGHDYENAGHGYLHSALIAACLCNPKSLSDKMNHLLRRDFYYSNLATAHYPDHGVFCTDVCHTIPAIISEMTVGSDEEGIHILPALVGGIPKGRISGLKTRCGATITSLEWDTGLGTAQLTLLPERTSTVSLTIGDSRPQKLNLIESIPISMTLNIGQHLK